MTAPGRIALVDDEENLRETVGFALRREGYRVELYPDGLAAWQSFEKTLPDLAILDILMPRMDGLELCRRLRALSERLPILFLTSKDEEFDRVLGLELGADDYLCKPFSMRELAARVKVLLRRAAWRVRARLRGRPPAARPAPLPGPLERRFPPPHRHRVHPPPRPGPPPRARQDPQSAPGGGLSQRRLRERPHDRQPRQAAAEEARRGGPGLRRHRDRLRLGLPLPAGLSRAPAPPLPDLA